VRAEAVTLHGGRSRARPQLTELRSVKAERSGAPGGGRPGTGRITALLSARARKRRARPWHSLVFSRRVRGPGAALARPAGPVPRRAERAAAGRTPPPLGPGGGMAKTVADLEPASGPAVVDHRAPLRRRRPGGRGVFWASSALEPRY
jgi:hypothetical protein